MTNQIEEALMRDPTLPAHREREPLYLGAALAALLIGWLVMEGLDLPILTEALIAAALILPIFVAAGWLRQRAKAARRAAEAASLNEARANERYHTRKRIEAAKADGDFDRWNKP